MTQEDWERDYKPILSKDYADFEAEREAQTRWSDPDEDGKGKFELVREVSESPVSINFKPVSGPVPPL